MEYKTETRAALDRPDDRNAILAAMALLLVATVGLFVTGASATPFVLLAGGVGALVYARIGVDAEGASAKRWYWAGIALISGSLLCSGVQLLARWMG